MDKGSLGILYTEWREVLYDFCNWDTIPDECLKDAKNE